MHFEGDSEGKNYLREKEELLAEETKTVREIVEDHKKKFVLNGQGLAEQLVLLKSHYQQFRMPDFAVDKLFSSVVQLIERTLRHKTPRKYD
jgi:hypothetical protein